MSTQIHLFYKRKLKPIFHSKSSTYFVIYLFQSIFSRIQKIYSILHKDNNHTTHIHSYIILLFSKEEITIISINHHLNILFDILLQSNWFATLIKMKFLWYYIRCYFIAFIILNGWNTSKRLQEINVEMRNTKKIMKSVISLFCFISFY